MGQKLKVLDWNEMNKMKRASNDLLQQYPNGIYERVAFPTKICTIAVFGLAVDLLWNP